MKRHRSKLLLYSGLNGLVMLVLTFYWLSLPYTFGDETFLIKWTSLIKKGLLGLDAPPPPDSILLIDISPNKTTIPAINKFGDLSEYSRKVITDREQLAQLIEIMLPYKNDIRLVVLDVLFEDSTRYDSLLAQQLAKLGDKALVVSHLKKDKSFILPSFEVPHALATYRATNDLFLKYPLVMEKSLKTVPLTMLEKLDQVKYRRWAGLNWLDNKLSLPAPLVDFRVRPIHIEEQQRPPYELYSTQTLDFLMFLCEDPDSYEELAEYFSGRLIMLGDFKNDTHATPFGNLPGVIIIYNAYLTLAANGSVVSILWLLFLWSGYSFMSYRVFSEIRMNTSPWLSRIFQSKVGQIILNALDEALILAVMTICSYFLFNKHINILILLFYIKGIEYFWKYFSRRPAPQPEPE